MSKNIAIPLKKYAQIIPNYPLYLLASNKFLFADSTFLSPFFASVLTKIYLNYLLESINSSYSYIF